MNETIRLEFSKIREQLISLQNYHNMDSELIDDIIRNLLETISIVELSFLRDWHSVEMFSKIINNFENYFQLLGFDMSGIYKKIYINSEIQYHLNEIEKCEDELKNIGKK